MQTEHTIHNFNHFKADLSAAFSTCTTITAIWSQSTFTCPTRNLHTYWWSLPSPPSALPLATTNVLCLNGFAHFYCTLIHNELGRTIPGKQSRLALLDRPGHLLLLCGRVLLLDDVLKVQDDEKKGVTRYKVKCWGRACRT